MIDFKKIKPHLIAFGIFLVICLAYFPSVLGGYVLDAHDVSTWKGMSKEVIDHRESTGEEALWSKRMFSGMPAYQFSTKSNGNLVRHIDTLLHLGLPSPIRMLFMYLIGFYILLVTLKIDFRIAIVGSIAFAFSSYFFIILQAGHMTKANAIGYMPLIVASVLYTFSGRKVFLGALWTSLFVALQLYTNHYQITYYTIILLFFIGIVHLIYAFRSGSLLDFFKRTGMLFAAALLAAGTNYTRLSTTLEYSPETQRGKSELTNKEQDRKDGLSNDYILEHSYGKAETMTFLIPNFKGGSVSEGFDSDSKTSKYLTNKGRSKREKLLPYARPYWGEYTKTNKGPGSPTYVGAIIVFLCVLGVFYVKSKHKIWILIVATLAIMLGWGQNFLSFSEFFINYVPAYNKFRAVSMIMILAQFCIALLAVLALQKFINDTDVDNKKKKLKLSFYITGGITLILALFPSLFFNFISGNDFLIEDSTFRNALRYDRASMLQSDAFRSFIFISLSMGVLWMVIKGSIRNLYAIVLLGIFILVDMWGINKRYLNKTHFGESKESVFKRHDGHKRILKNNKENYRVFNFNNPFNESETSYFHNSIGGYHAAKLGRYQDVINSHLSGNPNKSVLSMLNTGWFLYQDPRDTRSKPQAITWNEAGFLKPQGDAWFISTVNFVKNADEEIQTLDIFDPSKELIVDERFREHIIDFQYDSLCQISLDHTSYKPNHLTYIVENMTSDQIAVFSEIYYEKGWNAYIDGNLIPHFRANYVLRSMMVPSGTEKIEFKFEPSSYYNGEMTAYISSIFLLCLLGFVSYKEIK